MNDNVKSLKSSFSKCSSCGSSLVFDPKSSQLICESCGSIQPFEKSTEIMKHNISDKPNMDQYNDWIKENKVFKCQTCGAQVVLDKREFSKKCPYCSSPYVAESAELPGIAPDSVLPFAFDEKDAVDVFQQNVKHKYFIPNIFKKKVPESKVSGLYVPSFTFDANSSSNYSGELYRNENNKRPDGTIASTHQDFFISGSQNMVHQDVVIEVSNKISYYQMKSLLPYNMSKAFKYDSNFIRGYCVEHFSNSVENSYVLAQQEIRDQIRQAILGRYDYDGVTRLDVSTTFSNEKYAYRILPVYNFEFEYKNKKYLTVMNGQTGKIGTGLPLSKWKIALAVLLGLVVVAGIVVLAVI